VILVITITVCIGSSCHLKCSYDIVGELQNLIKQNNIEDKVTVKASFCLGNCTKAVSVTVNDSAVISVSKENVNSFFNEYVLEKL
jgi:NADH:ubiquinone oxidoreductase subunit E